MTKFEMNINEPPIQKHCKCDYTAGENLIYELDVL